MLSFVHKKTEESVAIAVIRLVYLQDVPVGVPDRDLLLLPVRVHLLLHLEDGHVPQQAGHGRGGAGDAALLSRRQRRHLCLLRTAAAALQGQSTYSYVALRYS